MHYMVVIPHKEGGLVAHPQHSFHNNLTLNYANSTIHQQSVSPYCPETPQYLPMLTNIEVVNTVVKKLCNFQAILNIPFCA